MSKKEKLLRLWMRIKSLNLYDTDSDNALVINRQRQTTRLLIIFVVISLCIIACYIGIPEQVRINVIKHPSQTKYELLQAKHRDTLVCPCNNFQISYSSFISLSLTMHPICYSGFISPVFLAELSVFNETVLYKNDFTGMSIAYFTHIATICELVLKSSQQTVTGFQQNQFISTSLMTSDALTAQVNVQVEAAKIKLRSTMQQVSVVFADIMIMLYALSTACTSFTLSMTSNGSISIEPSGFPNCSCILDTDTCSTDAGFYQYNATNDSFTMLSTIMGIRVACTPFHSTLISTLECWYSAECHQMVSCIF